MSLSNQTPLNLLCARVETCKTKCATLGLRLQVWYLFNQREKKSTPKLAQMEQKRFLVITARSGPPSRSYIISVDPLWTYYHLL